MSLCSVQQQNNRDDQRRRSDDQRNANISYIATVLKEQFTQTVNSVIMFCVNFSFKALRVICLHHVSLDVD